MASTKVTFVTGTAEVKRRDPNHVSYTSQLEPEQHLTTEPNTPSQVTYVDGKCTCCPYGYHIDLDFLNFCRDLESGSTLKNLKRIQRTKRKLRKSMELMLDEQEGIAADPNLAPPDVVHSTEAGRLMHMINYERSATNRILNQIDSTVMEGGRGRRYMSSDSDEPITPITPYYNSHPGGQHNLDESNRMTPSFSTSNRTDSLSSLSSVSTVSSEAPMLHQAQLYQQQQQQRYLHSLTSRTTTEVVENPVLEMATAEMKHYSTTSSAQLADEPDHRPQVERKPQVPAKTPPPTMPRASPDVNQMSLQSVREAMAVSLHRMRELEEQVKTIPILQVRISVLKEEKRLLNLQLKASKSNSARAPTISVGVGDGRVDVVEKMDKAIHPVRQFELPKSFSPDATSPPQKSPVLKSPPPTLPKPVKTVTVGVGDHSVIEPYNLQPDLPTGYTIRENETYAEIHTTTILEQEKVFRNRIQPPSLNMSFQSTSHQDMLNRDYRTLSSSSQGTPDSSQPHFTINQIQRSTPKALTRTVGVGDGNVFEGSGLHVHEKEFRTIIMGQKDAVAKRNVGIECRVPTRDVGVSFMCDEAKPETRTVGVNVNYDTSGIMTSFDFKGETELRMALRGVLQRNVRSVGTNCNFKPATVERSMVTEGGMGISVGCGDEDQRIDVEIKSATVRKSTGVTAKAETMSKYVSTEKDWVLDASTNTYQADTYHKAVMTDRQRQAFAATNTEPTHSRPASNQTEMKMFMALDQIKHATSNTEKPSTLSTGVVTDITPTFSTGVNTTEDVTDLFRQKAETKHATSNTDKASTLSTGMVTDSKSTFTTGINTTEDVTDLFRQKAETRHATSNTDKASTFSTGVVTDAKSTFTTGMNTTEQVTDLFRQKATTYSTGTGTDVVPTFHASVNTSEKVNDLFHESSQHKATELKSILKKPKTTETGVGDGNIDTYSFSETTTVSSAPLESASPSSQSMSVEEKILHKGANQANAFLNQSEYLKKSTKRDDGKNYYSSYEISTRSSPMRYTTSQDELLHKSSSQEDLDKRNSAFERVSPTKPEEGFSETVVEHYVITSEGKKLISEEKTRTSSSGTNRSVRQYTDEDREARSAQEEELTSSYRGLSENTFGGAYNGSSSGHSSSQGGKSSRTEKSFSSVVTNPYLTVENLAEISSSLDADTTDSGSGRHQVSKTSSEGNLYRENKEKKSSSKDNTSVSAETIYDMRRAGSVEDFMPDDIRKYMSIDPSTSKDSGFGEDLLQRFSEESSSASSTTTTSSSSTPGNTLQTSGGGMSSTRTSRTITKSYTSRGGKMVVQETETVTGPDGQVTTTVTETNEDGEKVVKKTEGDSASNENSESLTSSENGSDVKTSSSSSSMTYSSSHFSGQGGSDSNLSGQQTFSDRGGFTTSGTKSFSETTMTTVGEGEERVQEEVGNYGSLDRKTGKLRSIMKRTKTETHKKNSKKGITFAESVTGGTGSSSEEEETSDSDSTTSYEEGSYDSQQGQVVFHCKDDEAIAQGIPGAQMFDQNIRETYELTDEVTEACNVLATYLTDSTTIQTKQLNASQNIIQQEWFQVSSHKLSSPHQVEDFLSSVNEISKRLLEFIVNMTDANGNTAIHYCISHCNFEITSLLLDSEVCNINKQNKAGYTPIMLAGLATVQNMEQREVVRRLFSLGDINTRASTTQQTALMLAASHGRTEMVKLLVEEGADYNMQDVDGSTALMCACEHGHLEIVNFLLAQPDIDANITDNENSTALTIAMEAGHKDVGVVLYKHLNFSKASSPGYHKKRKSNSSPTPSTFAIR